MKKLTDDQLDDVVHELSQSLSSRGVILSDESLLDLNDVLSSFLADKAVVDHVQHHSGSTINLDGLPSPLRYYLINFDQNVRELKDPSDALPWAEALDEIMHSAGYVVDYHENFIPAGVTPSGDDDPYTFNPADIDLFEHHYFLPTDIQALIDPFFSKFEEGGNHYGHCEELLALIEPLGFTFDYGLSGEPMNLMRIEHSFPHILKNLVQVFRGDALDTDAEDINRDLSVHFTKFVTNHPSVKDAGIKVSIEEIRGLGAISHIKNSIDASYPLRFTWDDASYLAKKGVFAHTFLQVGDLYFDAECTEGVRNPLDFPIFERAYKEYKLHTHRTFP
jgi:hypothetical protein